MAEISGMNKNFKTEQIDLIVQKLLDVITSKKIEMMIQNKEAIYAGDWDNMVKTISPKHLARAFRKVLRDL